MKKMKKIEMERAFRSWGLWLAIVIGLAICMEYIIRQMIPAAMSPLKWYRPDNATIMPISAYNTWIGGYNGFENALLIRLFPILASIPYGVSYLSDKKSGIVKNIYMRTEKKNYLLAKYIAVFITGGIPVALPLLVNYLVALALLPSLYWQTGVFSLGANSMWTKIFYVHPNIYNFLYIVLLYICGGITATLVLIISALVNNRFVAILAPYIITEFLNAVCRMSSVRWIAGLCPSRLFNMVQTKPNIGVSYVVYISVILLLGVVIYFIGGLKDETL